jgi:hypothetical protein
MQPLTIVVSFDGGEQVVPGGMAGFVASLVHEFGFQSAEATFHRYIVEQFPYRLIVSRTSSARRNFAPIWSVCVSAASHAEPSRQTTMASNFSTATRSIATG